MFLEGDVVVHRYSLRIGTVTSIDHDYRRADVEFREASEIDGENYVVNGPKCELSELLRVKDTEQALAIIARFENPMFHLVPNLTAPEGAS